MNAALPPALSLRGVGKSFEGRRVLSGIDLDVPAGRLVVLLGPSGSGKSTILRILSGLEEADEGVVEVGGRVVADPRSRVAPEARGVGMVFQTLELWPHMTAAENIAFGLPGRPRGRRALLEPRVLEVAGDVGLERSVLARRPPTLSGGERQRVAIARALAPRPTALLYDEPLAHLDPARRAEIRRLVRRLREASATTVLYVTHDAAEALEVGDEVVVLEAGRVVERGPPEAVYARPRTAAGARALGAASVLAVLAVRDGRAGRDARDGEVTTALGSLRVAGAPGGRAVVLRPEQVVPEAGGTAGEVLDTHLVVGGWQFAARLAPEGPVVLGRSEARLEPGSRVELGVRGTAALVDEAEETPA